jgi:exopolysaccharide/PEP-CTERM locus tyrosine autokinase
VGTIAKALNKYKAELAALDSARSEPVSSNEAVIDAPVAAVSAPGAGKPSDESEKQAFESQPSAETKPVEKAPAPLARALKAKKAVAPSGRPAEKSAPIGADAGLQREAARKPSFVPAQRSRTVDHSLISLLNPDGMEAELFRVLRTQILFPKTGKPPRTILVTSALPEEGKSFVASNLAINMARNVDEHVLLVDCDLRKPTIHTRFGFEKVKGLSEYLSDGAGLASLLLKTGMDKLTLLPSGAQPDNPSELVTSSRMAALIQELKARYPDRYIIFDSPPPMMAPETGAIANWADAVLLVVKYGTTPMEMVEQLVALLDREKIIGAVINRFNVREFRRYSYNKYYRYAYKKYAKDGNRHAT